jgi:hypothetical protein
MKIFVSATIRGEESRITKRYSVTAKTLNYILILSYNALCCGDKLLLLKVIASGIKAPLSLLLVIPPVTF